MWDKRLHTARFAYTSPGIRGKVLGADFTMRVGREHFLHEPGQLVAVVLVTGQWRSAPIGAAQNQFPA